MSATPMTDAVGSDAALDLVCKLQHLCRGLERDRCELRSALQRILDGMPGFQDGSLFVEHFDGEGNYSGREYVDPVAVLESISAIARDAILKTTKPSPR